MTALFFRPEQYPMLLLFVAADEIHRQKAMPPVNWPKVDVITDHNCLHKLLRWLNPSPGRGSTCSLWGSRLSCWVAGRVACMSHPPAVCIGLALRT
ncbi:hypothetical protein V8E53_003915 [Lactarius tabidus]